MNAGKNSHDLMLSTKISECNKRKDYFPIEDVYKESLENPCYPYWY